MLDMKIMSDLEKIIDVENGNKLAFCEPNEYLEIDKDGEIINSWTDCNNDDSEIITVKSSDGKFRKIAIPKKKSKISGVYKPWKNENWGNSMPDHW